MLVVQLQAGCIKQLHGLTDTYSMRCTWVSKIWRWSCSSRSAHGDAQEILKGSCCWTVLQCTGLHQHGRHFSSRTMQIRLTACPHANIHINRCTSRSHQHSSVNPLATSLTNARSAMLTQVTTTIMIASTCPCFSPPVDPVELVRCGGLRGAEEMLMEGSCGD